MLNININSLRLKITLKYRASNIIYMKIGTESCLFILILAFLTISTVYATSDTVNIDVNISVLTQIDVSPDYLNFSQISPGSEPTDFRTITILNIGSTNINNIFATIDSTDVEASTPIGASAASSYAAGSFLLGKNATGTGWYWLGRLEWNDTQDAFTGASFPTNLGNMSRGWYHNATKKYLFSVTNGTNLANARCNDTGTEVRVQRSADTGDTSTRDLTGSGYDSCLRESSNIEWSVHTCPSTSPLANMCVAVHRLCQKIVIYQWDYNTTSSRYSSLSCTNKTYVSPAVYTPGQSTTLKIMPWVPAGIPSGNASRSTLWITASAA
jgi:hypothetical protein